MVTSSKILTVTYGTFSCTLEGFDDPFTTLQMVAEYFRKLAAEDRYFGGVPQVPDAEALKRIAEQNNPHGIRAEIAENSIILHQSDTAASAAMMDDDSDGVGVGVGGDADDGLDEVNVAASTPESDAVTELPNEEDEPSDQAIAATSDEAVDDAVPIVATEEAAIEDAAPEDAAPEDIAPEDVDLSDAIVETPVTFFTSRRPARPAEASAEPAEDTSFQASDPVNVAAAVAAASSPSLRQPAILKTGQKTVEETLAAIRQNVEQAENGIVDDSAEKAELGNEYASEPDIESDAELTTEADAQTVPVEPEQAEPSDETSPEEAVDFSQPLVLDANVAVAVSAPDSTPDEIEDEVEIEPEIEAADAPDAQASEPTPTDILREAMINESAPQPDSSPEIAALDTAEADEPAAAATQISVPQIELPVASEPTSEADEADEEPPAASSLSAAEEDELSRDLAAALVDEADATDATRAEEEDETDAAAEEKDDDAEARHQQAMALLHSEEAADDRALDRLLAATRTKMDRPEQVRRMNALDQLKAAVAATEAEHQLSGTDEEEEEDTTDLDAYRDDLRRAQGQAFFGARTTPAEPVQPPLILVSEQRIDDPDTADTPREVAETDGNLALKPEFDTDIDPDRDDRRAEPDESGEIQGIPADAFTDATSFSDFAERIGAFDLTDLLEAAAAYTSIIESKPRFSRAQVMSKIAKLNHGDAFSKEAGLRAFGTLLREGKILRVQDGQFGISKASRFSIASRYND